MADFLTFRKGFKDGIPIALGYFSVAFAFGMLSISNGLPLWSPLAISITNFTGTGQFVGMDLICKAATYGEIALTLLIVNIRYILMSLSLSQKLSPEITTAQRLVIAFGNTDEVFGVSMQQYGLLTYKYMIGIILCSYSGWIGGTFAGAVASGFLPQSIITALGICLYAMFIAIIIPPAKTSKSIQLVIIIAISISVVFYFTPLLKKISSGWVIIIAGIISSMVCALAFPVKENEKEADEH